MFACCYSPETTNGQAIQPVSSDIDVLGAAHVTKAYKSSASSGSYGRTRSFRSVEDDTIDTWTYDPSECSSVVASPDSGPLREETQASAPWSSDVSEVSKKVVLGDAIVRALNQLGEAAARVTPKEQLNEELARLVAPFVQEVANTYRCSEKDAIFAINSVLVSSGFLEAERLRKHADGSKMHQARPAVGDDVVEDNSEACLEDEVSEILSEDLDEDIKELERSMKMQRLRCFLASSGFRSVNAPRAAGLGMLGRHISYPLHAAVKANDIEVIEALLWAGSDPTKRDSQRLTPLELGYRLNRSGSHSAVLDALATAMATPRDPSAPPAARSASAGGA